MKKIKVALIAGKMVGGGVESLLMSMSKYLDKDKFVVDLLVDSDSKLVPKEEIRKYGVNLIFVPPYQNIFKYLWGLRTLFLRNKYDIVHANISTLNVFPLAVAYFCNIPVRISHNHNLISPNAGKLKNLTKYILSFFSNIYPNYRVAPTFKTGKWVFRKKKFFIIKNGINPERFLFDSKQREDLRKKLGIKEDIILLGSFGRMVQSKNLFFLLKVFEYIRKYSSKDKYKLLLVGNGPEEFKLKNYVESKSSLRKNVIFVSSQKDISAYYSALDLYLFPSTAEAFGIAAIEAQTNGLITLVSKGVPDEASVSGNLFKKFYNYDVKSWSKFILNTTNSNTKLRSELSMQLRNKVFDSRDMVNEIEELYTSAFREQVK